MAAAWTWLWWTHGSPSPHHPAIFDALDPWLLANHTLGEVVELPHKHLAPVAVGAADHQVEPRWGFWIRQHGDVWDLAQCALWPGQRAWPWLLSRPQLPWRPAWPSWSHPCPSCPSWARWAWSWSCPWRRLGCWPKGWLEVSGQEVAADTAKMSKKQCMQTALWHAMKMIAWKLYQHHGSEIKFVYYV